MQLSQNNCARQLASLRSVGQRNPYNCSELIHQTAMLSNMHCTMVRMILSVIAYSV